MGVCAVCLSPQDRASGPLHQGRLRGQQHNGPVRLEGRLQVLRRPGGVHQGPRPQLRQVPGDPGGVHSPEELPGGWTGHKQRGPHFLLIL